MFKTKFYKTKTKTILLYIISYIYIFLRVPPNDDAGEHNFSTLLLKTNFIFHKLINFHLHNRYTIEIDLKMCKWNKREILMHPLFFIDIKVNEV